MLDQRTLKAVAMRGGSGEKGEEDGGTGVYPGPQGDRSGGQ